MTIAATFEPPFREARLRLTAPKPAPPARDLPLFPLARMMRTSGIAAWPARAYDEMLLHRRFLGVDSYLLNDPQAVRQTLAREARIYERPVGMRRLLRPLVGAGLLLAEGESWRSQRRMLAPGFTPQRIDDLIPRFRDGGETMLQGLAPGRINLAPILERAAIDVVGRAMFSLPLSAYADRLASLRRDYFCGAARPTLWDFLARKEGDFAQAHGRRAALGRDCLQIVEAIIAERRASGATGQADIIELLCAARSAETGAPLTPTEIRDQIATLLATGFVSTALVLFWAVYLLSRDRTEQAKVRAEVAAFPPERVACIADLANWPTLNAAIAETMRLYPPVPALSRVARSETEILGVAIRPGSLVTVSTWVMHRHHRHWTAPDAFMPERFAAGTARHPAFMPFGVGPRVCLGAAFSTAETAMLLGQFFSRFAVTLDDAREVTPVAVTVIAPSVEPMFRLEAG